MTTLKWPGVYRGCTVSHLRLSIGAYNMEVLSGLLPAGMLVRSALTHEGRQEHPIVEANRGLARRVNGAARKRVNWHTEWMVLQENGLTHLPPGGVAVSFKAWWWFLTCETALRHVPQVPIDGKSTLVAVVAWCHHATRHYLSQYWWRPMTTHGITRPQWINSDFSGALFN